MAVGTASLVDTARGNHAMNHHSDRSRSNSLRELDLPSTTAGEGAIQPDHRERQSARDAEYLAEWQKMPAALREKLAAAGVHGPDTGNKRAEDVGREDDIAAIASNRRDMSDWPDMAAVADKLSDMLMEQFGVRRDQAIGIAALIEQRVRDATMETQSLQLARIVGFFLAGSDNLQARAHGLAQAARMAASNGLGSLRQSAKSCGVSHEWMRRVAWRWCELLGLPPLEGAKSAAACEAYREDKKNNHWRKRTCKAHKTEQPA